MISADPLIQRRSPTGRVTGLDAYPAQGSEQMPESKIAAPFFGVLFTPKAETNRNKKRGRSTSQAGGCLDDFARTRFLRISRLGDGAERLYCACKRTSNPPI